ncbi:MAG: hypothetical protein CSA18_01040 [Deltaproteobacteria bacterium]|nr:MAG: hypothetical protein CSA18_01040 [Deltaproteobacteria bacterium]
MTGNKKKYDFVKILIGFIFFTLFSCTTLEKTKKSDFDKIEPPKREAYKEDFPKWYKTFFSDESRVVGRGSGKTLEEARSAALAEIVSQIEVYVNDEIEIYKRKNKDDISSFVKQQVKISSRRKIKNARLLNKEFFNNKYFVAYEVDPRPFYIILAEKIKKRFNMQHIEIPYDLNFIGNKAVVSSMGAENIGRAFKGFGGTGRKEIELSIENMSGCWYLSTGLDSVQISDLFMALNFDYTRNGKGFDLFLVDEKNSKISNRLTKGDRFRFMIEGAGKNKFVSMLNLYSDGRVAVLFENMKTGSGSFVFPDPVENQNIFEAGLIEEGKVVLDYYIAIVSERPVDLISFKKLDSGGLVGGEKAFGARKLLRLMDKFPAEVLSVISVETIP